MKSDCRYSVHRRRLCLQLGLTEKIPKTFSGTFEDMTLPSFTGEVPGKWTVIVYPRRNTGFHRIQIVCKCGKEIPAGRLHQHRGSCHA